MTVVTGPELSRARARAGRLGGLTLAATHDPRQYTAAARRGFLARFWPDDPDLDPQEAARRARAALKLHMTKLGQAGARKRKLRRQPN